MTEYKHITDSEAYCHRQEEWKEAALSQYTMEMYEHGAVTEDL